MQIIETTDKEKLKMYMKLTKKELAKMLIESNRIVFGMAVQTHQKDELSQVTVRTFPNYV